MENKRKRDNMPEILWKAFVVIGAFSGIVLLAMLFVTCFVFDSVPTLFVFAYWILGILFAISGLALLFLLASSQKQKPSKAVILKRRQLSVIPSDILASLKQDLLIERYCLQTEEKSDDSKSAITLFMRNSAGRTEITAILEETVLTQATVDRTVEQVFRYIEDQERIYTQALLLIVAIVEKEDDYLKRFLCEFTEQGPNAGEYAIGIIQESREMVFAVRESGSFQRQFLKMADMAQNLMEKYCNQPSIQTSTPQDNGSCC